MSAVQPPPDAADDDPTLDEQGRVIDLPAGALSSNRSPRARTSRSPRSGRPPAGSGLGAALDASLADVTAAAEPLADGERRTPGPRNPAPRTPRPVSSRPAPAPGEAAPPPPARPRAVPRPPAWQPVPWSEASARAARPAPARPAPPPAPPRAAAPRPQAPARPAPRRPEPAVRTAITLPFPTQHTRPGAEEPTRLRGVDAETAPVGTVPGWLLVVMVVVATMVAALAAYLLLRP